MPAPIVAPFGPWEPAQPPEIAAIFTAMPCPWWIAGGFAIELAIGQPIRDHGDIDVLVLRQDHLRIQHVLRSWEWWAADPPGTLRPWLPQEQLPAGVHDIWCRPGPAEPWRIQVMIDESSDGDWVSRRDPGIRRPIASIGKTSTNGIPTWHPRSSSSTRPRTSARRTRPTSPPSFPPLPTNNGNGSATRSHEPMATITHGETSSPRLRQQAANHGRRRGRRRGRGSPEARRSGTLVGILMPAGGACDTALPLFLHWCR